MRYCTLDGVSSKAEEAEIAKAIRAGTLPFSVVDRLADYFANLRDLDTRGHLAVNDAWISLGVLDLVLFTGRQKDDEPTTDGRQRVFAAIELDPRGRVGALIKLRCDYRGAPDEWDNNCADAIDRFFRGIRVS